MALKKQILPLKAGEVGLDTSGNPQMTDQAWLKAEDVRWTRKGALTKREGFVEVPGTNTDGHAATYKGALLTLDRSIHCYEGAWGSASAVELDTLAMWRYSATRHEVPQSTQALQPNGFTHEANDLEVRVVQENETIGAVKTCYLRTFNTETGRMIQEESLVSGIMAVHTRLVYDTSSDAVFCFYVTDGTTLCYRKITAAGSIGAEVDTALDLSANWPLDVANVGNELFMAIGSDALTTAVRICRVDTATPDYSSATIAAANAQAVSCWLQDADRRLWAATYFDTVGRQGYVTAYDYSASPPTQTASPVGIGPAMSAGEAAANMASIAVDAYDSQVYYTRTYSANKSRVFRVNINWATPATPTASGVAEIMGKAILVNKPWLSRGAVFVGMTQPDHDVWFATSSGGQLCAKGLIGVSGVNNSANDYYVSDTITGDESGDIYVTARQILDSGENTICGVRIKLADPDQINAVETDEGLLLNDSLGQHWDGRQVVEQGYLIDSPGAPTKGSELASGGALGSTAAYQWCYTYQWYDARGQLHESAPSAAYEKTFAAGSANQIWLYFPSLCNTNRTNVRLAIYRTTEGGTVFYDLDSIDNNTSFDTVPIPPSSGYNDDGTITDTVLITRATLYTTGGVKANTQKPVAGPHCLHQGRQFVVDAERPDTMVRYSKEMATGESSRVAVEHGVATTYYVPVPADGGDITALASYRDRLVVFKADRVYVVSGSGLSSTGAGRGYSDAYLVHLGEGCAWEKSVVLTTKGLAFVGDEGIRLLSSSYKVTPLGEEVREQVEAADYKTGVLLQGRHAVAWVSAGGPIVVYDCLYGLWSTWTGTEAADAVLVGSELALAASLPAGGGDETVRVQVADTYMDGATAITTKLESGWFMWAALWRIYRLYVFGYNIADHTLEIAFQFDMDPTWSSNYDLDSSTLDNFSMAEYFGAGATDFTDQAYILEVDPPRQKVTSMRFRLQDSGQAGQSFMLSSLAAMMGVTKDGPMLGADRRAS